jgi:phosphatidylglycerophosphatase A
MNYNEENIFRKMIVFMATGLGLGLSPVASGTVGSLVGVVILFAMGSLSIGRQIIVSIILVIVAMPICGIAEDFYGKKDDGRIVADEYFTFPICMLGLPWATHWWLLVVGFVVNRLLDIIKPPPALQAQDLVGGIGIVMDDVISSLYALGINHAIWYLISK